MKNISLEMLKNNLTPPQLEAALCVDGPCLILAGAGSGKTRVVTYKMAYLLSESLVSPNQMLGVTFTNKAAGELKKRLSTMLETNVNFLWLGTFHSICVKILRMALPQEQPLFGVKAQTKTFSIYDDDDQKKVIRQLLKSKGVDSSAAEIRKMRSIISGFKNKGIQPDDAKDLAEYFEQRFVADLYGDYQDALKKQNAFDFDDLLSETVELLKLNPDIRGKFQKKFKYAFVDEYQDTNPVQYALIKLLMGVDNPALTVVGDDDQSIYGWRGADLRILQSFNKDFETAKIFKLEENFRSSANIVRAAGSVIENNERKEVFSKKVFSTKESGDKVKIIHLNDENSEASKISLNIALNTKENYFKTAVFYRTNAQSRALEEQFRKRGIPYKLVGGTSFYQRKEIKDILGYLRYLVNPEDEQSLLRIINTPKRGIGQTSIDKLRSYAELHMMSLGDCLGNASEVLSKGSAQKVLSFALVINNLRSQLKNSALPNLVEAVIRDSGYQNSLEKENTEESKDRLENLEEFINAVVDADEDIPGIELDEFLQTQALSTDFEKMENDGDAVWMMTLHASKGLEFPFVHMSGVCEGVLPLIRGEDESELEEERRLFYVGATRAENELSIYSSQVRKIRGMDETFKPSRFISELDLSVCETLDERVSNTWSGSNDLSWRTAAPRRQSPFRGKDSNTGGTKSWNNFNQESSFKNTRSSVPEHPKPVKVQNTSTGDSFDQEFLYLDVGRKVMHPKYGHGLVLSCSGQDDNARVEIKFSTVGVKKLVLKFANLQVIG